MSGDVFVSHDILMSRPVYVIVGAGHAGRRAVESFREQAPEAHVVLIGEEPDHPYDRPVLSKDALITLEGEHKAFIKSRDWYIEQGVDLRLGVRVSKIDRVARSLVLVDHFGNHSTLSYHRLLLTTGSRVRHFGGTLDANVPVHYVRTIADTRRLRTALTAGKRIGVIGGGFIGLEVAASARTLGCQVTLIEPALQLLQRSMPAAVSNAIYALHIHHGVGLRLATSATALRLKPDGTIEITLAKLQAPDLRVDGIAAPSSKSSLKSNVESSSNSSAEEVTTLSVDTVVVGIGVVPNVELAAEAGLAVDNGIVVDGKCRTADPFIFAAGEVSNHFNPLLGRSLRIESWQVAENQPAVAVTNMLGGDASYSEVPWLWSDQYETNIQTLGIFETNDLIVVRGQTDGSAFSVLSVDASGKLKAVATVNNGRDMAVFRRLMQRGISAPVARWCDTAVSLRDLLK